MNAREFVDLVDRLICQRICQDHRMPEFNNESAELVKRQLTDYLLASDARKGIYAKGKND